MKTKSPLLRRLVSSEEAVPTASQHKQPCADCPWTKKSMPGWLGANTLDEWLQMAHGEAVIDCHCTTNQQCAGAAIYRANMCKSCWDPQILKLPPNRTGDVFKTPMEFRAHHNRK